MKAAILWLGGTTAGVIILTLALSFALGAPVTSAQSATPAGATPVSGECAPGTPVASPQATADATSAAVPNATPDTSRCVTIGSYDIYFNPNLVTIPANEPVTIVLPNDGASPHDFVISDHKNPNVANLNISVDINPGETKTIVINAPAGTYYFYCSIPGHEAAGMFGYLTVQDNASISATQGTVTPPAGS